MRQFARGSYLSRVNGAILVSGLMEEVSLDCLPDKGELLEVQNADGQKFQAEVTMVDPLQYEVVIKIIEKLN